MKEWVGLLNAVAVTAIPVAVHAAKFPSASPSLTIFIPGTAEGPSVGLAVGRVGARVGTTVGAAVGDVLGAGVAHPVNVNVAAAEVKLLVKMTLPVGFVIVMLAPMILEAVFWLVTTMVSK